MTNLTRFESNDGIELVIDTQTGEAFASQSGYARMSGKDRTTIVRRCQGCVDRGIKMAEILTPGGLQGCVLIPADTVFDWLLDDNVELARAMGKAGATLYIYREVGFKQDTQKQEPQIPLIQRQGLSALETLYGGLDRAIKLGNQRLIQQFEIRISQYEDAYVSLKQLPVSNQLQQTEQEQKTTETAIDVAIRLGFSVPSNFEGRLGTHVRACCEHLLLDVKDNRTAASSGKRLAVNCYPANNEEVEVAVTDYCTMMKARSWRTQVEQKAWEKNNKK